MLLTGLHEIGLKDEPGIHGILEAHVYLGVPIELELTQDNLRPRHQAKQAIPE